MEKEVIFNRRSIREFNDQLIDRDTLTKLVKAGMYAPSAMNEQSSVFMVIDEESEVNKLREVFSQSKPLKTCTSCIIVLQNDDLVKCPLSFQDLGAATENILLYATKLGIGSCWIGIYPREEKMDVVSKLYNLPSNITPFSIIALGYPKELEAFKDAERFNESRVHYNKF